ncbi:ATP-binding cassette transporter snq2 [Exophiala dermatitidis]|nr:ATP-binding cassette transporter snq2 [Exophiala dermatitidis]KAJ4563550.1 ATP-binding cassette transporter snq2 [Exophiala dermatitidis]KAJ4564968.1 ATP-binding cassette transporter snq2 [Exophiala dermatitidis]KAJ4588990.1 ATP-binding cassette transporter snq2 [Exophiala dermatitidis]KAJ4642268.1 ATP-binding cassette transporter snq2 [Exophiala dermatitidis]
MDDRPTPADTDVPGGYPETPSVWSEAQEAAPRVEDTTDIPTPTQAPTQARSDWIPAPAVASNHTNIRPSQDTVVNPESRGNEPPQPTGSPARPKSMASTSSGTDTDADSLSDRSNPRYAPLRTAPTAEDRRPELEKRRSIQTEDDLFKVLSQRRTNTSNRSDPEEEDQIERLMSRMFGKARQEHSEEEKTRHSGVVFRDLTVKGVGLGASLQPTVGDIFMGLPRMLKRFFTKGAKAAAAKPPVRELLSNFDGCVRPGEMLLVLGRPGAGCSTFLKTFCNQREGFEAVEGEVTYGGTDAKTMKKSFRGEVIYNPEDDLHYATLTVKRTLTFALQTRTPGKESRLEGESRADYVREFLRVVTKLFWIEHTLNTKVGNEYVRGVSGGERKRVSIAEGRWQLSLL